MATKEDEVIDVEAGGKGGQELDHHTDPFAFREGKTLVWKNVNMTLVRPILSNTAATILMVHYLI